MGSVRLVAKNPATLYDEMKSYRSPYQMYRTYALEEKWAVKYLPTMVGPIINVSYPSGRILDREFLYVKYPCEGFFLTGS